MKKLLMLAMCLTACGGQTETCQQVQEYRPVNIDGHPADWTMTLADNHSPGGCYFNGEVVWSNGKQTRTVESTLEFDFSGNIVWADENICPDAPCGERWSNWSLWEPVVEKAAE